LFIAAQNLTQTQGVLSLAAGRTPNSCSEKYQSTMEVQPPGAISNLPLTFTLVSSGRVSFSARVNFLLVNGYRTTLSQARLAHNYVHFLESDYLIQKTGKHQNVTFSPPFLKREISRQPHSKSPRSRMIREPGGT